MAGKGVWKPKIHPFTGECSLVPSQTKDPMTYEPMPLNLEGITCQEASTFSHTTYIACGAPAEALVWHEKDKRVYPMCKACAWHNLCNRGGRLLAGDRRLTR